MSILGRLTLPDPAGYARMALPRFAQTQRQAQKTRQS